MSKNQVLNEQIYNKLLDLILNNKLKPGDKITETKIANDYSTSRTPIREAMRKLESQGLLKIYPNRYAQIVEFSKKEIQDIGIIRISLDLLSIKLASIYANKADILSLKEIGERCLKAFHDNDGFLRRKLDSEFHKNLCLISKNELLFKMQEELSLKIEFILLHNNFKEDTSEEHLLEHIAICDCLLENNLTKAKQIVISHLSRFYSIDIEKPMDFFM